MSGVYCSCSVGLLVFEYLFTLLKAKDDQSVLNICQVKNIFLPEFFFIIYINYHGTYGKVYF